LRSREPPLPRVLLQARALRLRAPRVLQLQQESALERLP
jgi:hypothetical protein